MSEICFSVGRVGYCPEPVKSDAQHWELAKTQATQSAAPVNAQTLQVQLNLSSSLDPVLESQLLIVRGGDIAHAVRDYIGGERPLPNAQPIVLVTPDREVIVIRPEGYELPKDGWEFAFPPAVARPRGQQFSPEVAEPLSERATELLERARAINQVWDQFRDALSADPPDEQRVADLEAILIEQGATVNADATQLYADALNAQPLPSAEGDGETAATESAGSVDDEQKYAPLPESLRAPLVLGGSAVGLEIGGYLTHRGLTAVSPLTKAQRHEMLQMMFMMAAGGPGAAVADEMLMTGLQALRSSPVAQGIRQLMRSAMQP